MIRAIGFKSFGSGFAPRRTASQTKSTGLFQDRSMEFLPIVQVVERDGIFGGMGVTG